MSKADRVYAALQEDGALKTPRAGTATNILSPPVATEGLTLSREAVELDETVGSRAPTAQEYGGRVYEGDIELAARPDSFGLFLSMVLGPPTTTVVLADTVWKHVWNPIAGGNPGPLPATIWTINKDPDVDIIDKFVGVKGNEMNLSVEANAYLMATIACVGYLLDPTATEPAGIPQDLTRKWVYHQVSALMTVGAGSEVSVPLLDYSLDYSNNIVTDQFVLGSKEVENLPEGNIEPEVTFTPAADIVGHYRRSLLDTPEDVRLRLKAEGGVISGIHKFTFEVDLKRLQYTEAPVEIDAGETLNGVEVTAAPVLTESGTGFMEISITNDNDGDVYRAPTT
jgi:hypothetical protein